MNPLRMLLSLIPWVAFSLIVGRLGEGSVGAAALAAVALALFFLFRGRAAGFRTARMDHLQRSLDAQTRASSNVVELRISSEVATAPRLSPLDHRGSNSRNPAQKADMPPLQARSRQESTR